MSSSAAALAAAVLLADWVSGAVHWAEDTYARVKPKRKLPLLNTIARDNELHHKRPREFLARGWLQSSWDLLLLGTGVLLVAWWTQHLSWAVIVFVLLSINANQFHKWAHRNTRENPRLITWLQRTYLLQTPRHHGKHHSGKKDSHYCVVTNFLNPILEEVNFWRRLEGWIGKLTGRKPPPAYD